MPASADACTVQRHQPLDACRKRKYGEFDELVARVIRKAQLTR